MIVQGDCREVMATMDASSVDAIVTDPPYGISFMGRGWDKGVPGVEFWTEMLRLLKPGGHILAFGSTRTFHRIAVAIEDAGFEIRDTLSWLYGSGFPKSLDVSKAIDKAAGAERAVIGGKRSGIARASRGGAEPVGGIAIEAAKQINITAPATPDAERWQGWGTALKPAWEPIILARKPFRGSVAGNVLNHGTGAINIDGCRIGTESTRIKRPPNSLGRMNDDGWQPKPGFNGSDAGRWPANVMLDEVAAELLDEQSGDKSRFFFCPKASRSERNAGLEGMPERANRINAPRLSEKHKHATLKTNHHPTVKPLALMRWLVKIVTPPGGLVLDPFTGSGSTGCAATLEGLRFIGIEQDAEYIEIARKRIEHWTPRTAQLSLESVAD